MKVKVHEASDLVLDWMVAKCEGLKVSKLGPGNKYGVWLVEGDSWYEKRSPYHPSTDWAQGGPIIEREGISWHCGNKTSWHAYAYGSAKNISGPTPLIAAMRCYVASKLGNEVEIPDELF